MFFRDDSDTAYVAALQGFVAQAYGLMVTGVQAMPRGFYGETWAIKTAEGRYFCKIVRYGAHQKRYRQSFTTLWALQKAGLTCVPRVIAPVEGNALWAAFQGGTLGLFSMVEGVHLEDPPFVEMVGMLAEIYHATPQKMDVEAEDFSMPYLGLYSGIMHEFSRQRNDEIIRQAVAMCRMREMDTLHYMERLRRFAALCNISRKYFYITNGDVGGNVMRRRQELVLVDWVYPMLAPPERDLWPYMSDPRMIEQANRTFIHNGLDYRLQDMRLAYYCYHSYFYYLFEYLLALVEPDDATRERTLEGLVGYLRPDCWIYENLRAAERI